MVYLLNREGYANIPDILEDDLMNTINFSNSRQKFERIWTGNAYESDLAGDTPEEQTRAQMWYMQKYVLKKK